MIYKIALLSGLFAANLFFLSYAAKAKGNHFDEPVNLCLEKKEIVVLSCPISGKQKKFVSICASKSQGSDDSYVDYRFGTRKKLEMKYSVTPSGINKIYRAVSDTGLVTFSFKKVDYIYEVNRPDENYGEYVFIDIFKEGKDLPAISLRCKTNSFGDTDFNSPLIENGISDVFVE